MAVISGEGGAMYLTIQERLKDLRVERGLTLKELSEQTGLSSSALGSYESDDTKDISHYALIKLAKFYGVTADYLLGLSEMKSHPNADLADLRLSDGMIDVLKEGRVDTALLGELVTHPDFMKLLADISIYVNGIATMQIHNLNAWVEVVRSKIIEEYQPENQDMDALLSDAVLLRERDYFTSRVHEDIDAIMEDIREAHRGRSESGPEHSAIADLKQDLEDVANFKGSRAEAWLMMYCKQTQTPYNKLSEEEKHWLMKIAQKSKLAKSHVSQRGKKRK
jgi:transcriptional regulator with XRE-family HTH domain